MPVDNVGNASVVAADTIKREMRITAKDVVSDGFISGTYNDGIPGLDVPLTYNPPGSSTTLAGWVCYFGSFTVVLSGPKQLTLNVNQDNPYEVNSFSVELDTLTFYTLNPDGIFAEVATGTIPTLTYSSNFAAGDGYQVFHDGTGYQYRLFVGGTPFGQHIEALDRIVYEGSEAENGFDAQYLEQNTWMEGGAGDDTFYGAFHHTNVLSGGADNDYLAGMGVNDILDGGEGNDYITDNDNHGDLYNQVHYNSDTLLGGGGEDTLFSAGGHDFVDGGADNDTIAGTTDQISNDTLVGGTGDDRIHGGAGVDLAIFNGERSEYAITAGSLHGYEWTIVGPDGTDHVSGVELLRFEDGFALLASPTKVGTSAGQTIQGTPLEDILDGREGNDSLFGLAGADILIGGDGSDRLDGGSGADFMFGGAGNDTYTVDDDHDVVDETFGAGSDAGGTDLINASRSFSLDRFLENLTLTGTGAIDGTGNELANAITGNTAANTLDGGLGADVMRGGNGNDSYAVDHLSDQVVEEIGGTIGGTDTVTSSVSFTLGLNVENLTLTGTAGIDGTGNELNNAITGNTAANTLNGGFGDDTLSGGGGDDTLVGGEGVDRLNGGLGADVMRGGNGNDSYTVDHLSDQVVEEMDGTIGGIDTVTSSVSFTLGPNIENLTLSGTEAIDGSGNELANKLTGNNAANALTGGLGNDTLTGNGGADTLYGGANNDVLNGGAGLDIMYGGSGNDTYTVDDTSDVVREDTVAGVDDGGVDLVISAATFTLGSFVENLTLTGTQAIAGTGNAQANKITGNGASNELFGLAGNDTLSGGAGSDRLDGGAGADVLTGGTQADTFVFHKGEAHGDRISDLTTEDLIELEGYGEGSTITQVAGSTTNWLITDGADGAVETITLSNKYALTSADWVFI